MIPDMLNKNCHSEHLLMNQPLLYGRCWKMLTLLKKTHPVFKYNLQIQIFKYNQLLEHLGNFSYNFCSLRNSPFASRKIALIPQTKQPGRAGGHRNEKLAVFFFVFLEGEADSSSPHAQGLWGPAEQHTYTAPSVFTLKLPTIKSRITSVQSREFHSAGNSISNTETIHAAPGLHLSSPGMKQRIMSVISWSQSLKLLFSRLYEDICY